ncbi:unnamed protein product [Rotaria sp. Silwood1]|nr:unnamed protein product [Rotaria sp. Silwood1]
MSPSPPSSHKRQNQTAQQSLINTHSLKQPSSLISSNNTNKRYRPSQSLSLTRTNNFQHVRQYPMKLEIFKPSSTNNREYEKQTTIIRNYDYEIQNRQRSSSENKKQQYKNDFNMEQEYLRCLNDVKNEYENLQREKKSFDNRKNKTTYETTKQYENVEKTYHHHHHHQPRSINKIQNNISNQTETNNTCQRSLSETLLHKNFKPIIKTDITLSDENLKAMEYCLQHQQRLIKPIHIHSSANFIPGERSIKYVHTERSPVEIILPKPQITKTHEEHTSAIVKDIRNTNRGTMTTIHQKPRSRSIEGERELRIFQKPIETLPIEQLSTNVIKSKTSDHLHTFNLNNTLTRQRTLSGEYKFRRIPEPMQTNLYNQQVNLLFPKSTHHSSTIVKQNRIPKSSIVLDNIQTKLKGEHELRLVDKPIQAGPTNSVELVVPKSITKIPEHTTTIVTEQQPHRRVLQVTGSGKKQISEHETKYFHDTVRIEEEIEVKLPKTKLEQVEHSATIIKHNRGKAPIIEIDATQKKIEGEHLIKILNEPIETTPDTMQLLVKKPKLSAEYSTTMIKEQHKQQQQILTTDRTQPIPAEHQTRYHDRPIESYEKMDVSFSQQQPMHRKPFIYDDRRNEILHQHSLTLIDNSNYKTDKGTELISSKQPKGRFVDHYKSANDHNERFVSSTINEEETISEHKTTYLKQTHPKYGPVELVVDRPTILPSVSKLIADIPALPQITSIKSTEILSSENNSIEFNSNSYKSYEQYDEMEIIDEKPSIHDSSKILITNIQPSKPTPYLQQPIEDSSTSLTMELNRNQQIEPFELIIPRIDMESSTSTILADVSPVIAGLHAKIDIPSNIEKLTSSYIFEQTKPLNNEIELIMPKPKHIETSTSTMIADVQAKLETKDIRPNEIQPETSTTTYYFDKTIDTIIPEPIELRMKQPIIGDSSTTVIAKVASPLDTKPIQLHTNTYRPLEHSLSTMPYETIFQQNQSSNIESILSRPQTQESTSITLTDIQPTFNTSQKYIIVAPPLENPLESSSQMILEENNIETETVELNSYQQSSSHTPLAKLDDTSRENEVMYVLGFDNQQQQQQQYAPSTILANLNKPVEFVFNVENDNTSEISQQYRQDYSTRMVTSAMDRITNGATSNTATNVLTERQSSIFTWFKDDAPLVASSRFTTYYDIPSKLIILQINDARPNDTGIYTVRADNKSGTVTTSATLHISSLPSIRDQSFISTDKFYRLEQGNQPRFIEETSGVDERPLVDLTKLQQLEIKPNKFIEEEQPIEQFKPSILIPLRNVQAVENQPVVLSAQIQGKPQPQFVWFKNNQPLSEGNRFRTHYDIPSKTIFLTIAGAREDDSAIYRLIAQNPSGQDETSCEVHVNINQPIIDQRSFVPQTAFEKLEKPLLKPSDVTSGVDQTSFFNQELFRPFDEQPIKHTSAIVGGEESEAVMPITAPKIFTPLRPITTSEGNTVLLTIQVEGYPLPQFTWFLNNQPLMASNRVTSHYDMLTKRCFLQILDSRPSDTGTYELIAENPAGQDRTKTELTIVPVSKIDQTGYVPYDKFSTLEFKPRIPSDLRSGVDATPFVSGEIFRLLEAKHINEPIVPEEEQNLPLEVLVPLKLAIAQEGQPVILTTKIRGRPVPQFTWLRNNQPLLESNRFQTHYYFPSETLVLEISDIWPHDSGNYTVIAHNPKTGERAETSAPLVVRSDTTPVDYTAFVAPDAFRTLEAGPNLRTVFVEPGVDTQSFLTPDVLKTLDQVKPKPMDVDEKEQPRIAPKVVVHLQPIKCNEGQPINFIAKVEGNPHPVFTWFKNDQPLQESNRFWTHYDVPSKTVLLQINGARPDDSGKYVLVAKNPLGQDQTQTTVNVTFGPAIDTNAFVSPEKFAAFDLPYTRHVPLQSGVDTTPFVQPERFTQLELKAPAPTKEEMEHMEAPKIVTPLQSVQVNEGSPVLLQATIVGKPRPNFVWLKDNVPLVAGNRLRTRYDIATKQVLLQINDVRPQDIGEYVVIATNPAGQDSTICSVNVVPDKKGVDERAFVPQDKFRNLEAPEGKGRRPLEIVPGVDVQPFVSPEKFRKLDHVEPVERPERELQEPKRAPRVLAPLSNCDLEELMPVLLTTTIDAGMPMATFTWFKNGQPLLEGNRFTTKYDILTKTLTLQVLAARPDDQGTYTVRVTNPSGTDETTCKLTIRPIASIDTRPFVQPERFAQLELKAPAPTKEDMKQMEAPKVIVPLQSVQVNEGSPVLFQATIVGKPRPNFVWLKDNKPLAAGNRLRTRYDIATKQVLLQIDDVRPQDIGEYVVIATNPAGQESTICSLNVVPDKKGVDEQAFVPQDKFRNLEYPEGKGRRPLEIVPGVDVQPFVSPEKFRKLDHVEPVERPERELQEPKRAPRVISPLINCELEELMPVLLTTTIDAGVPMATFTWFKNGQPLLEGNRFTTKYDIYTKTLTLQVLAARPDDQGTYTVRVTNPSGTDETTCKLTIRPIASIDTRPFIQPEYFTQLELKAPAPTKEDMKQMEAPKVVVPLKSVQVNEGSPILLQAKIVGKPTPNFVWLKDGAPLAAGNRLRTRYDIGTKQVLLQIDDVRPQDIGEYVVIATNPAGQDSTICLLNVLPDKPGVDDRAFIPQDKFRNLEAPEGKGKRPLEIIPGVDVQPFVSPDKFRKLDHVEPVERPERELQEPKRAPRVIAPLSNCDLEELMPVLLTTTIDAGVPMASFTWYKNNKPLLEGNRFTTKYDILTKVLTLQVLAARPDDQGTYTVRATNPSGTDETTCKLTIRPIASIDTRPFIQPDHFAQLELKAPVPTKEDMDHMEPPKVIVPLKPVQVNEGSPILLQAKIVGKPTPNFVWLKDNVPLAAGNRLRTRYDIGTKQVLLQIDDVRPNDTGEYHVIATNPAGQDSTICSVNVVPEKPGVDERAFVPQDKFRNLEHPEGKGRRPLEIIPGVDVQPFVSPEKFRKLDHVEPVERPERELQEPKRAPRVISPLINCELEELMPVILTSTIDAGVPMASFTWYKNGQPLLEGNRFTTKYDIYTKTLTLQILAARPDDIGTYTVRATNPSGSDETTCKLTIRPIASIDTRPFIQPETFAQLELKAPAPTKEEMEHMEPPKVVVPLKSLQVDEGAPVLLQATITGKPRPKFVWLKDNKPLAASNRLRTRYDIATKQVLLQIDDVRPHDIGEYVVVATNPAGEDSTICSLGVVPDKTRVDERPFVPQDKFRSLEAPEGKGPRPLEIVPGVDVQPFVSPDKFRKLDHVEPSAKQIEEVPEPKRAPRVIVPLSNCELEELMPVLLTTTIDAGVPMATFTWYKNNKPLLEGNRFTTKYDILTKVLTLQVLAARPNDQGTYTVRATNPSGSDETTCKLTIRPVASIDTRPYIQPERFAQLELQAPAPTKEEMEHMEPPKVIVPLEPKQVKEGSPVLLQATITGKPRPNFVWLKDNQPLTAGNRLRTRYDIATKQVLLQINDVRPQDVGEYRVIATNPAGKDSTVGSLNVVPDKPGVDERPFVPQDKFRSLEAPEGKGPRPLEIVPGVDIQPFVSPDKFRKLDHVEPSAKQIEEVPEPKRPPRVIVPLSNCELEELMPVILTTTIDAGVPMATFTWYKNNKPLLEGNRFTTKYDILTKVLTLQVLAARPDDQGTYTVRATNPSGSDETTCKLTIRPVASIDTRPYIQPERFAQLELQAPAPTKEEMEHMEPPKVIVPLEPKQVKEGSPVLLQATITGKPRPNFVWLKDNQPLTAGNRLRTRYDIATKQVLLQINDVRPQDVGEYRVIATNPAGKDSTVGSLNVVPDKPGVDDRPFVPQDKFRSLEAPEGKGPRPLEIVPGVDIQPFVSPDKFRKLDHVEPSAKQIEEVPEPKRPPRVIVPLSNCELEELMPVILTTTIDAGVPMATFTWYKNNKPLLEGNRFTTKYDILTKVLTLQVLAARPDDQGTYTVRATNPSGSDETTCKLTIRPVASIDTRPFVQPERFAQLELKAPAPTKEEMEHMEPPKVIVPLKSLRVKEGSPVLLQATITGKPRPTFVWLKDNGPLAASNRLRTRYDIGTKQVLLQINDVRPQDVGEYRVIATNPAGEDSTICSLSILPDKPGVDERPFIPQDKFRDLDHPEGKGRRPLEIIPGVDIQPFVPPEKFHKLDHVPPMTKPEQEVAPEAMRPPRVIVPLNDCILEELMPVILTATIDAGVPMASFTWHKNGQPLYEGNRFTTKYDIVNRTITLQILASRPDDQGTYTVRAVNPVGSDETTCKLTIRPVASIDTRPFVDAEHFRPLEHRPGLGDNIEDENKLLRPPKVLVPMNNVRLTEFQPIVLKSIIDAGYPMGKFTWLKDNRPLAESNRYRANFDINTRTAILIIDNARPTTDTGRYTVHVENIVGKDQTTGEVHVEGTPSIDERPFIEPSKFGKFDAPLRVPGISPRGPILQPDDSLRNRENLAPWIRLVKELEDQMIDETKVVQLICAVDAYPAATINWLKDDQPLVVSQRFMPDYDTKTGIVRLTIYPVYAADSGRYKMVARNIAGEVSTKCILRIQPTANIEDHPLAKFAGLRKIPQQPSGLEPSQKPTDLTDGLKPYFIKVPVDQEVPEGQLVRLDYIPAGRPYPTLSWYRNGKPLQPDDADHREVVNEGGAHSLLVRNPQLGPPVEYKCVATNKYGEASFTVNLTVVEHGSNIAPYFIELLYHIIILEGQDTRLDACAQGFPEPKVTWEKEGQPLTPNKEYKVETEGAKTTLFIRQAKMTDAGWYQCTATSIAGTAITKCKVTVIPLSEAGQYIKDLPQLGPETLGRLPILPEEDIRSKYMTAPVKTPEVKPEELYKLPRRIKRPDYPDEEGKRRGGGVLPDEVLTALQMNLEEFPEEEMYSKDRPQPPKFKVHLKSQLNLNEDDPCLFEAKLIPVRDPMMRVQWFKNGKILHHASRMIPRYDFADVSLEFLWTFAEDDGIYECVATNPYGEDRTRTELKCRPKRSIIYNTQLPEGMEGVSKLQMLEDEIRYTASMIGLEEKVQEKEPKVPEFIMPLEDVSVDEGDNAKFIAKVDGHPRPRVTWTINNADIANGSRYKLVFDGLVHYLDIPRTRQYDAGIVCCTAKNALGQSESVAILTLRPRLDYRSGLSKTPGGIETGLDDSFDVDIEERLRLRSQLRQRESVDERLRRPSSDKLYPLHSKATDRMAWRQTVEKAGDAPNFTRSLLPLKAKEGSKVVVSVEFTGDPAPTVSWYRDGFMVEDSEDFKIHTTATKSILTIKHAFIIDSGLYTVKLFNPIGIRQCQAAIRILPIIAEDQTPRFLDVPQDTEILAGDPARFQCRAEGEPFPTVAFYREDEPVNLNDKRFRVIQEGDVFTLLLFEALPADSGQYEAVAENSAGKANTRFTLIVTPRGPGGKKASIIDDPKLIHKVPYLETPLEDLQVKEGQSATFECIIPASFGSDVKWYKGTSEWPIKPSKFFKPKSDGTKHQLFILEAYPEDAGLYKCVVSNPVGTTATTASLKVIHSMQVPEFVRGFSNLTTYEGEQVRFEVEVRGDPLPTISWYRDGELIRDSPDFQIFTEQNRSLFYISEVFMEDQGLFTCKASNSAGSSDCSARLIVEPRPQL